MKKILVFLLSLIVFMPSLNAVSSSDVNYEVYDYIVDARMDISGNMTIKEVIGIKGTYNGYIRDLVYKNSNLSKFTGKESDFESSDIYNASNIELYKVGLVDWSGELSFSVFDKNVTLFEECNDSTLCYEKSKITNGISIKMYNETKSDITYFYIEYLLGNVAVIHNDIAEVYYNFIGTGFDDEIKNYQLRLLLPEKTKEQIKVWAHGPLNGEVYFVSEGDKDKIYYGSYMKIKNLPKNTPVDMRLAFPKNLIMVDHPFLKKTNVDALDLILKVEEKRAEAANDLRKMARIKLYGTYGKSVAYIIITVIMIIYIYTKYDKEPKSSFEGEYYREFIDDYDVTVIEYLFDKKVTEKAFSTSILNMIYKKNIKYMKLDKKDYMLTKVSEDNLTEAEKEVMKIIFKEAGDGRVTTLKKIKKYASEINDTVSPFLTLFDCWKNKVISESEKHGFYENHSKIKLYFVLYGILGFVVLFLHFKTNLVGLFTFVIAIITGIFIIYVLSFTKRTIKGTEHYAKWNAFKKFLNDFGRFDEKELPEIELWERYLVYASIFGVADELCKTMKVRFAQMPDQTFDDGVFLDLSHLNTNLSHTINDSISLANTKVTKAVAASVNSSGGGFGGGFSGGGGFGGGGGGGRGF